MSKTVGADVIPFPSKPKRSIAKVARPLRKKSRKKKRVQVAANTRRLKTITVVLIGLGLIGIALTVVSLIGASHPTLHATANTLVAPTVTGTNAGAAGGMLLVTLALTGLLFTSSLLLFYKRNPTLTSFSQAPNLMYVFIPIAIGFLVMTLGSSLPSILQPNTVPAQVNSWGLKKLDIPDLSTYAPGRPGTIVTYQVLNGAGKQVSFSPVALYSVKDSQNYTQVTYQIKDDK